MEQNGGARTDSAPCVALLVCLVNKSVSSTSSTTTTTTSSTTSSTSRLNYMIKCSRKQGGQFSSHDIAIVTQCLRATIGVLLTNLTLESELRIKSHLQKLLTVAKNLFSHLGECK